MLSIFLAEELERTTKSLQNSLFLQYFCDNKDEKRNTAVGIILGLLFQLLELQPKLFHYILPEFKIQGESLFDNSSFPTLWGIFETMLRDPVLSNVYCILDGLDECDAALLEDLLKKFSSLFPTKSRQSLTCHLKLIIVSRELPKFISTTLQDFPRIRLDPDADSEVYYDILRFIDVKVDELSSSCSIQHPEPRVHIRNVFRDRAQGTFLWVALAAKALEECKATEITAYLDVFPPGLDYLYARLLLQINVDRRETAAKILRWVVMAVRPLTLSELSAVVDIPFKPATCFEPNEAMRDQVSNCGYFLTIKDDEVSLIHQSAKEYLLHKSKLEDFRVKEEVGNLEIATKCFYYLQELARWDSEVHLKDTTLLKEFPFLSYAILHWPEHARFLARSESIFDLSTPFYSNKSQIPMSWIKAYCDIRGEAGPPHSYTLLHLASYFGILPLAENLLLKKRSINIVMRFLYVNKRDSFGRAPLHLAAWEGHEAVVRLLLEKGADTNAKDRQGGTALCWAAPRGHEAVIRLLLEKGADIEAKYMSGGKTALASAAWEGHEAVVRLLLEKGANIEAKDISDEKTALVFAASAGHEAVVRLLLEKGADIEAKNISDEKTALVFAVWGGYNAVVQLLLEKGANVEAKCQLVTGILDFVLCFDP
jgi:ankyrin repeat protein